MLFKSFGLILLLFHNGSCTSSIALDVNDLWQPLVCALSEETQSFNTIKPIPSLNNDDSQHLVFSSKTERLITACPSKIGNPDVPAMLIETQNDETTCHDSLHPAIYFSKNNEKCGNNQDGVWSYSGYRVQTLAPFLDESIHFGAVYSICYLEDRGVLFTWHTIYPGKRAKPFEIWAVLNKFEGGLKVISKDEIDPDGENRHEIQLVPFDHLKPMAWKIATLFDFNFITATERVKTAFDELDKYLLDYTDETSNFLQVFSGIKLIPETIIIEHIVWYWRMAGNVHHEVLFMISNREPKPHELRCNSESQEKNFLRNSGSIPGLILCKITESLMEDLNITIPK